MRKVCSSTIALIFLLCAFGVKAQPKHDQGVQGSSENPFFSRTEIDTVSSLTGNEKQRVVTYALPAPRGRILDRNGVVLADSAGETFSEAGSPSLDLSLSYLGILIHGPEQEPDPELLLNKVLVTLEKINTELGTSWEIIPRGEESEEEYRNKLKEYLVRWQKLRPSTPIVVSPDIMSIDQLEKVSSIDDRLIFPIPTHKRIYPHGEAAAHALGYISGKPPWSKLEHYPQETFFPAVGEGQREGQRGIENLHDGLLRGKPGKITLVFDANGDLESYNIVPPIRGADVYSTIDIEMQKKAEEMLARGKRRSSVTIADPQTGEILVMASYPSYDPNKLVPSLGTADYLEELKANDMDPMFNMATQATSPPGSNMKIFSALAYLEDDLVGKFEKLDGSSPHAFSGETISNYHNQSSGYVDLTYALKKSVNTPFTRVAVNEDGYKSVLELSRNLGLHEKTGVLPVEAAGSIPDPKAKVRWPIDKGLIPIGQGPIEVSQVGLVRALSAVANVGSMPQLSLVRNIDASPHGRDLGEDVLFMPLAKQIKVNDPENYEVVIEGMRQVVNSNGTAGSAKHDRVLVAGKTGTAEWMSKGKKHDLVWFSGFAPAVGAPQYVFSVQSIGRSNESITGGGVAAPILSEIFSSQLDDETLAAMEWAGKEVGAGSVKNSSRPSSNSEPSSVSPSSNPSERKPTAPAYKAPQKKQGLFNRLFGGRR
ncbi:penicillin-binding protein 2 [bacterium]|nr:penicillin-binding protein 2 [bacterium]